MDAFLRFLSLEQERIGSLVILGDLFEFFFGFKPSNENGLPDGKNFPFPEYLPVLKALQEIDRQGVRIEYFEGNHDFFLRGFFRDHFSMGVEVHPEGCETDLAGRKVFIAHGDLSNPRQWKYRTLRKVLRNRWTHRLIQWVGPERTRWVAQRMNAMSQDIYHGEEKTHPPPTFREFAHEKFTEGFDVVILGHSHFAEAAEEEVAGRRCAYYNVGDWRIHRSFLRFTPPGTFRPERFEG